MIREFPDGTKYRVIDSRPFDWCASLLDGDERMQGFGVTEDKAVMDLLRLLEEQSECNYIVGEINHE